MKRKGFTLVELLIVIAILGVLAAVMTISSGSSVAKAKATTIANNLAACKTAAQLYYLENCDSDDIDERTADDFISDKVLNWDDFSTGLIKYEALSTDNYKGRENWAVKVTITDKSLVGIMTSLKDVKGYSSITVPAATATEGTVTVKLIAGTAQ